MSNIDIKISQLNPLGQISGSDFFPIVQSSSLTTYRADIQSLNAWFSVSGSASYAPQPTTHWSTSSNSNNNISNLNVGFVGINQVNPTYQLDVNGNIGNSAGNITLFGTSSYSLTSSLSITASNAVTASYIKSASYASNTTSASYVSTSSYAITASNANSASFVLQSISSSYAATASYVSGSSGYTYPYIYSITTVLSSTNDNFIIRCNSTSPSPAIGSNGGSSAEFDWNNTSSPLTRSIVFENVGNMGLYTVYDGNGVTGTVSGYGGTGTPSQIMSFGVDNRGGSTWTWKFATSPMVVIFATSPTTFITQSYTVNTSTNYATNYYVISAIRASQNLNAILAINIPAKGINSYIAYPLSSVPFNVFTHNP